MPVDAKTAHNALGSVVQMYLPIVEELEQAKAAVAGLTARITEFSEIIRAGKVENERLVFMLQESEKQVTNLTIEVRRLNPNYPFQEPK